MRQWSPMGTRYRTMKNRIFSTDSAKAIKAQGFGYVNAIHYLAPSDLSGVDLCPIWSMALTACAQAGLRRRNGSCGIVADTWRT